MKNTVTATATAMVTVVGYDRAGHRWEEEVSASALSAEISKQRSYRWGNTQYLTTVEGEAIAKLTGLQASGARVKDVKHHADNC